MRFEGAFCNFAPKRRRMILDHHDDYSRHDTGLARHADSGSLQEWMKGSICKHQPENILSMNADNRHPTVRIVVEIYYRSFGDTISRDAGSSACKSVEGRSKGSQRSSITKWIKSRYGKRMNLPSMKNSRLSDRLHSEGCDARPCSVWIRTTQKEIPVLHCWVRGLPHKILVGIF